MGLAILRKKLLKVETFRWNLISGLQLFAHYFAIALSTKDLYMVYTWRREFSLRLFIFDGVFFRTNTISERE